jgi:hypothetical protein
MRDFWECTKVMFALIFGPLIAPKRFERWLNEPYVSKRIVGG